jgi:hypothetical protein
VKAIVASFPHRHMEEISGREISWYLIRNSTKGRLRDVKYGFGAVVEVSIVEIVEEKHLLTKFEPI